MYMECDTLGEGLSIGGFGSGSPQSMEETESHNSAATAAGDVDIHETSKEASKATDIHERLHEMISGDSCNFDSWTAIIDEVERSCPDNMDIIGLAYDSLLSKFPLCHWYWRKYAYEIIRLSDPNKAVEIFERALNLAMYSLGLWLDYCRFGMSFFEDKGAIRRLFKTGILFAGKDYYCSALWDQYITFEYSQQNWSSLANIYLQVLRYPTEKLHKYYDNFKKFVAGMEEEMTQGKNYRIELEEGVLSNGATLLSENAISRVIEDLQSPDDEAVRSKAVRKYKFIGDQFYEKACELDEKIKCFEANIQRRYFDVTPLGDEQLKNWHRYLDFMEKQGDFSWALQLFERCLISCANYPEFWIRYVEFMESKGGRELANFALERTTKIFLKDLPEIHVFSSRFKERIGDASAAHAAVIQRDMGSDFYLTRHVIELANMERRLGNLEAAYDIYDKAIKMAEEKKQWHSLSSLFIHLSRLKYMITGSADAARDVFIDGIQRVPRCRVLLEELIKFAMMHQGASQVDLLDSIVARAISPSTDGSQGLDPKDREDISSLFLEFVDLCGTVDDIRKARNRHIQLFPQFLRPNFVCRNPDSDDLSNEISEQRQGHSSALLLSQFEGQRSKINHILEEQVHFLPVNNDCQADLVSARQSPQKCNKKNEQGRRQKSSNQVAEQSTEAATDMKEEAHHFVKELLEDTPGVVGSMQNSAEQHREDEPGPMVAHDLVNQLVEDIPAVVGSMQGLAEQPRQDEPGPMEITPNSVHNSSGDTPAPNGLACNFDGQSRPTAPVEPSQEQSSSVNMQDQEFKHHMNPVYFENLSSNSQEKASQEITPVASDEHDAILETSKTNRNAPEDCLNANTIPPAASPNHTPTADSPQVQEHPDEVTSNSLLSPASHQMHMPSEVHMNSVVTPSTGGEFHKIKHIDTIPEDGTPDIHSHSEDQQLSPQQHSPTVAGSKTLMTRGYPHPSAIKMGGPAHIHHEACAVQQNMFTNQVSPVNPVPDQSSFPTNQPCTSTPLVSCPQPNLTPNTVQSSHQAASPHHNQTMNQIWQLNYQQNQHLLQQQYQQQLLQMMQQQQQKQLLPHQQQHNQQQACSSPQQLQVPSVSYQVNQLQQQQPPYFQQAQQQSEHHYQLFTQQAQLQQGQQQQFLQQQLYHQAEKLAYQMLQQGYEQHTAQAYAYQILWQQCQLHQQGYGQMLHQEQHHQQLHHVYNQMVLQQQQQPQLLQQQQQMDEQRQHYQNRAPEPDLLKGPSQNLQDQENAKGVSNPGRENTPESDYLQPQY